MDDYPQTIQLWRAVLIQAFIDSMHRSTRTYEGLIREEAIRFLTTPSRELAGICLICGYHYRDVIKVAKQFSERNVGMAGSIDARTMQIYRVRKILSKLRVKGE